MSNRNKIIGEQVRNLRKQKKMTMKELGQKLGVSEQAISQYELGKRKLTPELLLKISVALDVPKAIILTDHNDIEAIKEKAVEDRTNEEQYIFDYYNKALKTSFIESVVGFANERRNLRDLVNEWGVSEIKYWGPLIHTIDKFDLDRFDINEYKYVPDIIINYFNLNNEGKAFINEAMNTAIKVFRIRDMKEEFPGDWGEDDEDDE